MIVFPLLLSSLRKDGIKAFGLCRWCGRIYQASHKKGFSRWTGALQALQQIPLTPDQMKSHLNGVPKQPPKPRTLNVSFIGAPNAGKSTLANKLLGHRFTSVSAKVHTTRKKTLGVLTHGESQVVFLDTPGLITSLTKKKHKLEHSLLIDPHISLVDTDLLLVVVDVSTIWGRERLDPMVLQVLHVFKDKPSILVLNKVDLVEPKTKLLNATRRLTDGIVNNTKSWKHIAKEKTIDPSKLINTEEVDSEQPETGDERVLSDLTEITDTAILSEEEKLAWWKSYAKRLHKAEKSTREKSGWEHFKHVFMVSALQGDGIEDMRYFLLDEAKPGDWKYNEEVVTDQNPIDLAVECVREKLLDHLPKEIPYLLNVKLVMWEEDENGYLRGAFDIICKRKRDYKYALGPKGETIRKVSMEAKRELMNVFNQDLSLKLAVCLEEE